MRSRTNAEADASTTENEERKRCTLEENGRGSDTTDKGADNRPVVLLNLAPVVPLCVSFRQTYLLLGSAHSQAR